VEETLILGKRNQSGQRKSDQPKPDSIGNEVIPFLETDKANGS